MDAKRLLAGSLAGGIVNFFGGWLIYGMLLNSFMQANQGTATNLMKPETDMVWWAMIVSCLLTAGLLAYIFLRWANIRTFAAGAAAGAIIGLLIAFAVDLNLFAMTNMMTLNAALVDPIANAVLMALTGGVVGLVLGKMSPATA